MTTGGAQFYGDDVTLNGWYTSATDGVTIAGDTTLAGPTQVIAKEGSIAFGGRVDSTADRAFVLSVNVGEWRRTGRLHGRRHRRGLRRLPRWSHPGNGSR